MSKLSKAELLELAYNSDENANKKVLIYKKPPFHTADVVPVSRAKVFEDNPMYEVIKNYKPATPPIESKKAAPTPPKVADKPVDKKVEAKPAAPVAPAKEAVKETPKQEPKKVN